jgi:hypothetical protein
MNPEIRVASRFCVVLDMKNKDIFDKLQEAYGEGCVSSAWLCKWAKAFRDSRASLADDARSGRPSIPDGVERIHAKVECGPYQSGLPMARDLCLSKIYVSEVLTKVVTLKKPHYIGFRTFSTTITRLPASMLSILEPLTAHTRSWLFTGNESWFDFSYDCEDKWAVARDPAMTKPKALISTNHGFGQMERRRTFSA